MITTIRAIMMGLVLVCTIVGLITPFATAKTLTQFAGVPKSVESSFRFLGADVGGDQIDYSGIEKYSYCGAVAAKNFLYAFAFAIVAIIFEILTIVVLLVSTCVFKVKGMGRTINVILPVITCAFLIMATGCAFIYPDTEFDKCHTKLSDIFTDITPGMSSIMLLIATIVCFVVGIFSAIFDIMIWGVETFSNAPIRHLEEDDVYKPGEGFSPMEARLLPAPQPDEMMKDGISIGDDDESSSRMKSTKESGSTGSGSGDASGSGSGDAPGSGSDDASDAGSGDASGTGSGDASDDDGTAESDEY